MTQRFCACVQSIGCLVRAATGVMGRGGTCWPASASLFGIFVDISISFRLDTKLPGQGWFLAYGRFGPPYCVIELLF
jgi:hypothetical protein